MTKARRSALPYALLAPGLLWLVIFFLVPMFYMAQISLKQGSIDTGYQFTWHFRTYVDAIKNFDTQFIRSFEYAGLSTLISLLVGYPLAYAIAFRGGKYRNALLLRGDPAVLHHLPRAHAVLADDPRRRRAARAR